jgi:hypothetical protein
MKITEVVQIFGLLFSMVRFCINFDKKWVGLHLGDFFSNSSGHPTSQPKKLTLVQKHSFVPDMIQTLLTYQSRGTSLCDVLPGTDIIKRHIFVS